MCFFWGVQCDRTSWVLSQEAWGRWGCWMLFCWTWETRSVYAMKSMSFSCSRCLQSYKLPDVNHLLVWMDVICFTDVTRIAEARVSSINHPVVCNWLVCWLWMLKESLFAQTAGHLCKIQSRKRTYAWSCSVASPLSWRISWPFTSPGDIPLPLASQTIACVTCTRVHCHQVQCLCLIGDQICPVTGQYVEKDAGSRPHLYLNKSNSILS